MSDPITQPENKLWQPSRRSWPKKFAEAFIGIGHGILGQSSFLVHLPMAGLVLVAGGVLGISLERWCLLILCIAVVIAAELQNSCLECLCRSITRYEDANIRRALNIASGGVLVVALGAALVGSLILGSAAVSWFASS